MFITGLLFSHIEYNPRDKQDPKFVFVPLPPCAKPSVITKLPTTSVTYATHFPIAGEISEDTF